MQNHTTQELNDRLDLIERILAEGRRSTESWGWAFLLWGIVYYAAIAWSASGHGTWAWPVMVLAGVISTVLVASLKARHQPATTLGRATGSIWLALGISMFLLFLALGLSGRLADQHVFMAVISAMLGLSNGASALILHWKAQLGCAIVWWVAAVITAFGSDAQSLIVFLIAIFVCQIVFGLYCLVAERQKRRQRQPNDA